MQEFLTLLGTLVSKEVAISTVLLGLVVWGVFGIFTGRLVPEKRYIEKQAEADKWHDAFDTLSKAHDQTVKQNGLLMQEQHLALHVVRTLGSATLRESDFTAGQEKPT
jgi:Na+/glutamate symporter